ncbi:MAG: iron-containing alcohol dehydrogenase [Myxococcota bacterium]
MSASADSMVANWSYPTSVRFGVGRISELPDACRDLGMTRPLLITDPDLVKLPMIDEAVSRNIEVGLPTTVFSQIKANPNGKNVADGVAAFKRGDHDGVIAFGGGSALDAAKAVALMVGQSRPLWDYEDVGDWTTRVDEAGMAPVVAVPTTSGTGSEVGRASIIIDEAAGKKKVIFHPKMLPARVICDPGLTVGLPQKLTGAVGMDALSHNLEAYCTGSYHPMGDGIALEGMRLVHDSLVDAYRDGSNLAARSAMMAASLMGATAFQKGLGAMHSVGHAVGAMFDTHHGTTVAVMMPYVLLLNRSTLEDKMTRVARHLGLPSPSFDAVLDRVIELRVAVAIPETLGDLGVTLDAVAALAKLAASDPTAPTNPVALDVDNLTELIRKAISGERR